MNTETDIKNTISQIDETLKIWQLTENKSHLKISINIPGPCNSTTEYFTHSEQPLGLTEEAFEYRGSL